MGTSTCFCAIATVTPLLRTAKKDKKGRSPIWLRIADRNGSRFMSFGEKVRPSQWNSRTGRVRKSHPHANLLNKLIDERIHEARCWNWLFLKVLAGWR